MPRDASQLGGFKFNFNISDPVELQHPTNRGAIQSAASAFQPNNVDYNRVYVYGGNGANADAIANSMVEGLVADGVPVTSITIVTDPLNDTGAGGATGTGTTVATKPSAPQIIVGPAKQ